MNVESNQIVVVAAELIFAALFLRVLYHSLRRPDPLQRAVTLVFVAPTVIFMADALNRVLGSALTVGGVRLNAFFLPVLLLQPYLTMRLISVLRPVRRGLTTAALAGALILGVVLLTVRSGAPMRPALLVVTMVFFAFAELVPGVYLASAARRRTGSPRIRLWIAAGSTVAFAGVVILMGSAGLFPVAPGTGASPFSAAARVLAVCCGIGYAAAFLPPAWLRRMWSATALQNVTVRLLDAPATETGPQIWQRYAEMMREESAADAVAMLVRKADGHLEQTAYAGEADAPLSGFDDADLDELLNAPQPVPLSAVSRFRRAGRPTLATHYAGQGERGYLTALGMRIPPAETGAVLIFHRFRGLFSEDDLRLLADFGGHAGVLAERGSVLAEQRRHADEQRRLSDELAASVEKLTQASEAKSDFLANMSHELRTPLNAIIGFSDLMRGEKPVEDRRSVPADWVDHIHNSGRHLLGLINDILDLAKVEAGRIDLHPAPLRVDIAARELLTGLRPLTEKKSLTVEFRLPELTVRADALRFRQILENLLSNAIKFTPEGGTITLDAETFTDDGQPMVALAVGDTGIGISEADMPRVFEEFQQVGDRTHHQGGTGLGLALARRLVQAHGGDITVTSTLGVGSRFTVTLPDATGAPAAADTVVVEPQSQERGRILLIEDDVRSAELLRTYLVKAGYRVEMATSGESGLNAARVNPPDAILLDVVLPGIDGWAVIHELKQDALLATIPVLFISVVDERHAGIAMGAADFLVKPVADHQLVGSLARHIYTGPADQPTVLVVDDDADSRHSVEASLRTAGAEVVSCADGQQGLEMSRNQHFDLIVCDLRMPDLDGFSLLAAFNNDPANADVPVVALASTAMAAAGDPVMSGKLLARAIHGTDEWDNLVALASGTAAARRNEIEPVERGDR
ncbi:signal transduction histidine kinase/CheY-like chemotaxis protein [Catenuloplanes nepalensis]|uniref:histidine kinase n=1 Tax=Catenuloplanes nepalensis TaxID=587533 RepID=A0ABT9N0Q4_9ACTN|nr:response regulator [Catenuloplanes nepalensis]MDP9797073.1 signal transduction histidine kinase/CheY-like chemotaxis protein [Catenuloplanes nepalensis]